MLLSPYTEHSHLASLLGKSLFILQYLNHVLSDPLDLVRPLYFCFFVSCHNSWQNPLLQGKESFVENLLRVRH